MNKRVDIQILRACAVIFVVLFHLEVTGIQSGFLGVDVFFVVSGFLMAILYRPGEAKKFFKRRAKRLLPAYFATVILTLIFAIFIVLPSEQEAVITQSIYSIFFANNFGFWLQNSYFSKSDFKPLLHLWSLGVEIQFYLIVPILVFFFRKSNFLFLFALIGSFLSCIFILGIAPQTSFFMMPLRIWEFLIGFLVAYYLTINGNIKFNNYSFLGFVGLTIICAIPFFHIDGNSVNRLNAHPGVHALIVCIATALVLTFGLPKFIQNSKLGLLFSRIGDYSYSIYLVHFPIIVLYLYKPFTGTNLHPESLVDKVILFFIITVSSILMHTLIETRNFKNIKKEYLVSIISIVALIIITKFIQNYFYNSQEKNISKGVKDRATYRCGRLKRISNPKAFTCKINTENFDKSILLVGNSHSDSIKMAFSEEAAKKKYNTYFVVSNTPLIEGPFTLDILLKESNRLKINRIVMHYSSPALDDKLLEKIEILLKKKNILIDFIMPVPIYKEPVPKILYENNTAAQYDVKKYMSNNAIFFNKLETLESKYSNLKVYHVKQILCKPTCIISDENKYPYYFDSNHLNLTGAKLLIPVFQKIVSYYPIEKNIN
ncbi:acyltransferase family protein [Acinetobacter pittii]|uniref:acyltransferase family protein n=1 Tax=Acinetobacter pittii TaxID=48296 RepID=UPI0040411647